MDDTELRGTREIQTHYHDGWFVAVIVWSAPDRPARRADDAI
jgi:hypothetical protein